jgi:hypothetical protein
MSATGLILVVFLVVPEISKKEIVRNVTCGAVIDVPQTPTDRTQTGTPT